MRPLPLLMALAACSSEAPCPVAPDIDPIFAPIAEDILEEWSSYRGHACVKEVKTYDSEGHLFGPGGTYFNFVSRNINVDPDAFESDFGFDQDLLSILFHMPELMCEAANMPPPPPGAPPGLTEDDGELSRFERNRRNLHFWCFMGNDIIRWHERIARVCAPDVKPRTAWLQGPDGGIDWPHDGELRPVTSVELVDIAPRLLRFAYPANLLPDGTTLFFQVEGSGHSGPAWLLDTTTWELTWLEEQPERSDVESHRFELHEGPDAAFADARLADSPHDGWFPKPVDQSQAAEQRLAFLQVSDRLTLAHDDVQFPLCGPRPRYLQWFPKHGIAVTWPLDEEERLPTVHVYAPPSARGQR